MSNKNNSTKLNRLKPLAITFISSNFLLSGCAGGSIIHHQPRVLMHHLQC